MQQHDINNQICWAGAWNVDLNEIRGVVLDNQWGQVGQL